MTAVGEAGDVDGNEFVLAVGLVPVAHLGAEQVVLVLRLIEDVAVLLIDDELVAIGLLKALVVAHPCILEGIGSLIQTYFFHWVVPNLHLREIGLRKVFDGGLGALVVHFITVLCCHAKHEAGKK